MDSSNDQQHLRHVLLKIQDLLSNEDRERLHFLLGNRVPKRYREDPTLGGTLRVLETLFDQEMINEEDCHYLIRALKEISCFEAAKQLLDYQRKKSSKTIPSMTTTMATSYSMIDDMEDDHSKLSRKMFPETTTTTKNEMTQTNSIIRSTWSIRELILAALLSLTLIALLITIACALRLSRIERNPLCSAFNVNLVNNGDAETGPCEIDRGIKSPIGWNFNGSITQISYENREVGSISKTSPGPSNRGECYFFGHMSLSTSMWQTIDLSQGFSQWIDQKVVKFRLSAWLGGWSEQNDHGQLSVTFLNQTKHQMGQPVKIEPVTAEDRNYTTSMIFRQVNGTVPVGTRLVIILVKLNHISEIWNDASVDNISFKLFL